MDNIDYLIELQKNDIERANVDIELSITTNKGLIEALGKKRNCLVEQYLNILGMWCYKYFHEEEINIKEFEDMFKAFIINTVEEIEMTSYRVEHNTHIYKIYEKFKNERNKEQR